MKKIKKLVLALGLTSLVQTSYAEGFNTVDLVIQAATDMPDCLDYKANKVVLKMTIGLFGIPEFFFTLNISHNSPNWLTMTHNELSKTPYKEYNFILGDIYEKVSEVGLKTVLFNKGIDKIEVGGGRYQYKSWGEHQSVQYTEAMVIGHPGSMILKMFDKGGLKPDGYWVGSGENTNWHQCKTHGCLEEQYTEIGQGMRKSVNKNKPKLTEKQIGQKRLSYLKNWQDGKYTSGIYDLMEIKGIHDQLKSINKLGSFFKEFGELFDATSAGLGVKVDRVFCEMQVAPFIPYYLSGFDAVSWRMGYPIADPEYSTTILNPLSKDTIGTDVLDPLLKKTIPEKWGNIYPREGTVNISSSAKLGAVVAYRANSVLTDKERSGIRVYKKPFENTIGAWNKVFPKNDDTTPGATKSSCHKNIANTGIKVQTRGMYAYTSWPRYTCDLASGMTILEIPVNINITDKVPE